MKIQFESSTACNARCIFCPRFDMARRGGEMSDVLFHKIIADGKDFKRPYFLPFLNGEPFAFSRIWEWLDYMQDQGVPVSLTTNAELIDPVRLAKYDNIREVCCSVNAATKPTYDRVMRGPDFEKVIYNVKKLQEMAKFRVSVSMVVVAANQHETFQFKAFWGKYASLGEFKNWGGLRHDDLERQATRIPCPSLFQGLFILHDGRVVMCCLDHEARLVLGDANTEKLSDIWRRAKAIRRKHRALDFDYEPCRDCNQNI
jgi:radical SAM protein with 4Fe4S-binding SPASM domain